MNCLIVDDNAVARTTLAHLAGQVRDIRLIEECEDAISAYNKLQHQPFDLLLLDIEMPGMTGLELTRNLTDKNTLIVFISSKKEYAVEAFELRVADYIVKPITPARFLQAIDRVKELRAAREEADPDVLFFRDAGTIRRLNMGDILYAEAMGDYVRLYTTQKTYTVHTTLKAMEERLPASRFLRVHRSYVVAVDRIDTIRDGTLIFSVGAVPIADAYRAALNKRLDVL